MGGAQGLGAKYGRLEGGWHCMSEGGSEVSKGFGGRLGEGSDGICGECHRAGVPRVVADLVGGLCRRGGNRCVECAWVGGKRGELVSSEPTSIWCIM